MLRPLLLWVLLATASTTADSWTRSFPTHLKPDDHHNHDNNNAATLAGGLSVVYDFQRDHCASLPELNGTGSHPCPLSVSPYCDADIPDGTLKAFRTASGSVRMLQPDNLGARYLAGPSLGRLKHPCRVYHNSTYDPAMANYASNEWVMSPYIFPNQTVVGLTHMEFHNKPFADEQGFIPGVPGYANLFSAVTLLVSPDAGSSWHHHPSREDGAHMVAATPIKWDIGMGWQSRKPKPGMFGYRSPSNIIKGRANDGHYYATITAGWGNTLPPPAFPKNPGPQRNGLCMMRTRSLLDPKAWRAWNGTAFSVDLGRSPYAAHSPATPPVDPSAHCRVISNTTYPSLLWSTYYGQYLLFGTAEGNDAGGWQFSLSPDLVEWSKPTLVQTGNTIEYSQYRCPSSAAIARAGRYIVSTDPTQLQIYWQPLHAELKHPVDSCTLCPGVSTCEGIVKVAPSVLNQLPTGAAFDCDMLGCSGNTAGNRTGYWLYLYPTLLDPSSPSANFEDVGQNATLFLVGQACVGRNQANPEVGCSSFLPGGIAVRDVVSAPVTFRKSPAKQTD